MGTSLRSGRVATPAKLNLSLEVLSTRPDGYHGIRSVAIPIGLYDELRWEESEVFSFECNDPKLAGPDNLVVRTAKALGLDKLPLRFILHKEIPQGAGLGGGSSNAAGLILAARRGAFGHQARTNWLDIASGVGSDVPLFLAEGPALVEGRGERVTPLGASPPWWTVVIYPGCKIATSEAYRLLDTAGSRPTRPRARSLSLALTTALQRQEFTEVCTFLSNDFEASIASAWPEVATAQAACLEAGKTAHLTGSGAALFTLFQWEKDAREFYDRLVSLQVLPPRVELSIVPFATTTFWQQEHHPTESHS